MMRSPQNLYRTIPSQRRFLLCTREIISRATCREKKVHSRARTNRKRSQGGGGHKIGSGPVEFSESPRVHRAKPRKDLPRLSHRGLPTRSPTSVNGVAEPRYPYQILIVLHWFSKVAHCDLCLFRAVFACNCCF